MSKVKYSFEIDNNMKKFALIVVFILLAVAIYPEGGDYLRVTLISPKISFDENDDITVYCVVHNTASVPVEFTVYDTPYTTFQPVVYLVDGKEAPLKVEYRLKNIPTAQMLINEQGRKIILQPDEKFVYTAYCNNFYTLTKNEKYRVKAYFYPDAKDEYVIKSANELTINIVPVPQFAMRTGIIKHERKVTPSEVVMLALMAEKNKQWGNVVKYINIEKFIYAYSEFAKRYSTTNDYERLIVQQDFINFITKERPDYLIDFSIIGEQIMPQTNVAYVDVKVKRWGPRFPATMKYRYTLEPYKDLWVIVNLDASIVKE